MGLSRPVGSSHTAAMRGGDADPLPEPGGSCRLGRFRSTGSVRPGAGDAGAWNAHRLWGGATGKERNLILRPALLEEAVARWGRHARHELECRRLCSVHYDTDLGSAADAMSWWRCGALFPRLQS